MYRGRKMMLALLIGAASFTATSAFADRDYHRDWDRPHHSYHNGAAVAAGLVLGSALLWAATRPAPAVYEAPPMAPLVIAPTAMPPHAEYWYYCRPAGAYYPYVGSCPVPWEAVPAHAY
jgi:hypothetical protein